jgi:diketogulonate reductase-like aldo/keto reductase
MTCELISKASGRYFVLTLSSRILLHAPYGGREAREGSWRALIEAQKEGKVRSIGVSNYGVHHLDELEEYNKALGGKIDVGQYELHPWLARPDIVDWLKKRNVVVQAYSPLVQAKKMDDPLLQALVKKHNKTPAQILIRWSLQKVCRTHLCWVSWLEAG